MENQWLEKREYIADLAVFLYSNKKTMSLQELGEHLNRNGFMTDYNTPYSETHGKGVGNLVNNSYKYFAEEEQAQNKADAIACAFVKENGEYAYNKQ